MAPFLDGNSLGVWYHRSMKNVSTLTRKVLELPVEERARLAERLLDSLEELSEEEIERLWAREAVRRVAAFEAGEMKAYPADEVHKGIRRRFE